MLGVRRRHEQLDIVSHEFRVASSEHGPFPRWTVGCRIGWKRYAFRKLSLDRPENCLCI